jgi:hypothetical protein
MKKIDNKTKPNPPTIFSDDFKIGKLILGRVKGSTFVLRLNFCAKIPHHRQYLFVGSKHKERPTKFKSIV